MAARAQRRATTARELVAATPATRNRYVDLLRFLSIALVVLGHWLLAVLGFRDGEFVGENLLELAPRFQIATWLFQVMPIFFLVGGYTNAISWESAMRRGESYGDWLHARCTRLLRPALWFVAFWTVLPMLAVAVALPSSMARVGGREVSLPLWFLSIYVLVVAAAPAVIALHRRFGASVFVALAAGVILADVLHYGLDQPWIAVANYAFVWLTVVELGLLWRDGTLRARPWIPWAMLGGGVAILVVLVTSFDYPVSMITLSKADRSNAFPPSLALHALGVAQAGAVLLVESAGKRWLERPRVWLAVATANSMIMTFYLWNMSAVVLAAVLVFPSGLAPQPEPLSTGWWWLRPAWIALCAVCLLPFLFGFRRASLCWRARRSRSRARLCSGPPSAWPWWRSARSRCGSTRSLPSDEHHRRTLPKPSTAETDPPLRAGALVRSWVGLRLLGAVLERVPGRAEPLPDRETVP